ncbi:hypothetical protein O181_048352 [Austropuccinia psidii MF-1]|uniref:Uncharacterized protein n=1 Tax=Austropuccinia psidii MF-1 TaxID=1389203 RepID=A0A9Q3DZQ9_9BASI|nr:hypothetical protein [Austropuccinia psidii MF-1]
MSHLFLAQIHPPNHLRTFRLVSHDLKWLQCNPRRNLLVSLNFTFFTIPNFSSPFLQSSPACHATPHSVIIINDTPAGSPPPQCPQQPHCLLPLVPSSPHSHNDACQEFTNLGPTLMIP